MIQINNVKKVYASGVIALENVSIHVEKGDIFGIIGLSGAGKSTLIRCINRLENIDSGKILINGVDIGKLNRQELVLQRSKMGMIFQHFNLLSRKTCAENIAFPLEIAKMPKPEIAKRVDELLELVELTDKKNVYPSQLSGGQKQRVAIARALANNSEILLCDEATSALDPSTTLNILELLKKLNKKLGITIVLITHQMEVIKNVCNKVAVIDGGHIDCAGSAYDLFSSPKTEATSQLLGTDRDKKIPKSIWDKLDKERVFRLTFNKELVEQPIIANLIQNYNVQVNIYEGHIETIQDKTFGQLLVSISGQEVDINNVIKYFNEIKLDYGEVHK